jgi:guanidinoacetate N-methyltransferase
MTRRIRRHKDFEISLQVNNDTFIRPPRDAQRNWLLNRALSEFVWDLENLDDLASRLVSGSSGVGFSDRTQAVLAEQEIMEDWQIPIMSAMARIVSESGGDVLEVGFGRGVASAMIQEHSHTVVECNDTIVADFHEWKRQYPGSDIRVVHGKWQDTVDQFGEYDGVFFHTYPLNEQEALDYVAKSVTFAEHFFPVAASHLRPGGVFSYLTNEPDSLSREHQRLLFRYFGSFQLEKVPVSPPADSKDDLWADSMIVVKAVK